MSPHNILESSSPLIAGHGEWNWTGTTVGTAPRDVFGIPPELKPAIANWVQERVKRIEAGRLPYIKDGLLYSLWKYANADKLAGKDLIAFTDLIPLEGTDRFTIYEFLDEIPAD